MLEASSVMAESPQAPVDMETDDMCWICLDDTKDTRDLDPLVSPCLCPRKVHPRCLARWQLQQAGRLEETNCRFCQCNLADWKVSLTPENLKPDVQRVQPIMVVYFEGQIHRIPVKQGPHGLNEFTLRIRELFRLPEDVDISLTFGCKEPLSGQHLKLEGIGAFDAAVHCASVAAAERHQKLKSGGGAGGVDGDGAPTEGEEDAGEAAEVPAGSAAAEAAAAATAVGGGGGADPMSMHPSMLHGGQYPLGHPQHQHHHYQQQHQHAGMFPHTSASAPASANTSGGGSADGAPAPPGGAPLLHPAASAPALAHYGYSSDTFAGGPFAASPAAQQQQFGVFPPHHLHNVHHHGHMRSSTPQPMTMGAENSYPGCSSLSDGRPASAAHSARTSSGGGGGAAAASPRLPPPPMLQSPAEFPPLAVIAAPPPQLPPPAMTRRPSVGSGAAAAGMLSPSPFQSAALGSRYADIVSRGAAADGTAAAGGGDAQGAMLLRPAETAPGPLGGTAAAALSPPPLADSISEPSANSCFQQSPAAPLTPPGASPYHYSHHSYNPSYTAQMPSYSQPSYTSYTPSSLPPLPPSPHGAAATTSGRALFSQQQAQQLQQQLRSGSPSPSSAAVPPTPRDHYEPGSIAAAAAPPSFLPYHQQHERYPTPPAGAGATDAAGPSTPIRPIVRRTTTGPTPLPRPPLAPSSPSAAASPSACSPSPSSPTTSGRHHPYLLSSAASPNSPNASPSGTSNGDLMSRLQAGVGPLQAGMLLSHAASASSALPSPGASADDAGTGDAAAANRRLRRTSSSSPRADYDMCGSPSPTDDAAALGSLTGRLKFSLRAFSRKVARSLNFQRGAGGAAGSPGGSSGAAAALLSSVAEAGAAEVEGGLGAAAAAGVATSRQL